MKSWVHQLRTLITKATASMNIALWGFTSRLSQAPSIHITGTILITGCLERTSVFTVIFLTNYFPVYVIFLENDKFPKNSFVTIPLTPSSDVLSEPPLNSEGEWRKRLNNINSWLCVGISPEAVRFILAGSRKPWHFLKLPSMSLDGRFPNTLSKLMTTITLYRAS